MTITPQSGTAPAYTDKASQNGEDAWRTLTFTKGTFTMTMSNHATATLGIEVTQ